MKRLGLRAIWPRKRTTIPNRQHPVYPYLLRGKEIWLPNQVWAADITYIRLQGSYVYLVEVMDLYSRKVLAQKASNTMEVIFCVAALEEAIAAYGVPRIFDTDQGSRFTSEAFTQVQKTHGVQISMDGFKRALDNIYVERLWRTLKYEEIYFRDYQSMVEFKQGLTRYVAFHNQRRYHQSLEYQTPDEQYHKCFYMEKQRAS